MCKTNVACFVACDICLYSLKNFYYSSSFIANSLISFSCTSVGTSSYDANDMMNDARPPVSELSAVEYDESSFKGTLAESFS